MLHRGFEKPGDARITGTFWVDYEYAVFDRPDPNALA